LTQKFICSIFGWANWEEEGLLMENKNKRVRRNLYRVLRKTGVKKEDISLEASFQNDLHFDTTDWKIFTFYLENIFKVNIEDERLKKLKYVNDTLSLF
jgi:acyl carrier protein